MISSSGFPAELKRVLRHSVVQFLLAAERVVHDLKTDADCDFLARQLPRELVETTAHILKNDDRGRDHLLRLLKGPEWSHPMAASLFLSFRGLAFAKSAAARLQQQKLYGD